MASVKSKRVIRENRKRFPKEPLFQMGVIEQNLLSLWLILFLFAFPCKLIAQDESGENVVKVKKGDTVMSLAEAYYGGDREELFADTGLLPEEIVPGIDFFLPSSIRKEAVDALEEGWALMTRFEKSKGPERYPVEFTESFLAINRGKQLLRSASYDKARDTVLRTLPALKEYVRIARETSVVDADVTLGVVFGEVVVKAPGHILHPVHGVVLPKKSRVENAELSRTSLELPGHSSLTLDANSAARIVLCRYDQTDEKTIFETELLAGTLQMDVQSPGLYQVLANQHRVIPGLGALVEVDLHRAEGERPLVIVRVLQGQAQIQTAEEEFTLKQGQIRSLDPNGEVQTPEPPVLVMKQGAIPDVFGGKSKLAWGFEDGTPVDQRIVRLELAHDNDFTEPVVDTEVKGLSFEIPPLRSKAYFWRLRPVTQNGIQGVPVTLGRILVKQDLAVKLDTKPLPAVKTKNGLWVLPAGGSLIPVAVEDSSLIKEFQVRKNGGPWKALDPDAMGVSIVDEEPALYSFRAMDEIGTVGPEQSVMVQVDRTPPRLEVLGVLNGSTDRMMSIHPRASDSLSGVEEVYVSHNRKAYDKLQLPLTVALNEADSLRFYAVDAVGNKSIVQQIDVRQHR